MSTSEEVLRFVDMLNKLVDEPQKYPRATVACPNASTCRKLRRRFYYLRENLPESAKEAAAKLSFKVNGRVLVIELEPQWRPKYEQNTTADSQGDLGTSTETRSKSGTSETPRSN
jgi:hypothetical protein